MKDRSLEEISEELMRPRKIIRTDSSGREKFMERLRKFLEKNSRDDLKKVPDRDCDDDTHGC